MARIKVVISRELDNKWVEDFKSDPIGYVECDLVAFIDDTSTKVESAEVIEEA